MTLTHVPLQSACPLAQLFPAPEGFAQLATKSARLKQATSADKKGLRTVMFDSFNLGGRCCYPISGRILQQSQRDNRANSEGGKFRRCRPDLNRGMRVLQTLALPLGHGTVRAFLRVLISQVRPR